MGKKSRSRATRVGAGSLLDLSGRATARAARTRRTSRSTVSDAWLRVGEQMYQAIRKARRDQT